MKKLIQALVIALITSAAVLPVPLANADGPWGIQLFGMQFGQGRMEGPLGMNLFGVDYGQRTGYAYPHIPYAQAPMAPLNPVVPQAPEVKIW